MADFVVEAMQPYFSEFFYNPSSPYAPAVKVRREYEVAKQQLAETFGAKGDEVVITAGATESINLVFSAIAGHVVTSKIEHPAVLESAKRRDHTLVEVSEKGMVSPEAIRQAVRPDTSLVSIAFANNELGTLQPIRRIAQMIETERRNRAEQGNMTPLLFHCDASQGFDQMDIHVARLGVDLLTLNAGKVYGPKQVGLLWTKRSAHLEPYIVGGGQERGLRSGTENVAGTIGFAVAAHRASEMRRSEGARLRDLRDLLQGQLTDAFPESVVLGSQKHRLPGHLSMAFPMIDAERIIFLLEARGIYVATGSACSANKHTASHVLRAIGIDEALINGSLRFTLGRHTTKEQILLAAEGIIQAVSNEYQRMERTA